MHRLLRRQFRRLQKDGGTGDFDAFARLVEGAYCDFDETIERLQLSLDLSSRELRRRNDELRTVFSVFPDIFLWLDRFGRIIDMRGGATGSFATVKRSNLVGRLLWEAPLIDQPHLFKDMFSKRTQEPGEFQRSENGLHIWCEIRLVPISGEMTVVAMRDISELKKRTDQLRSAEEQYRSIFENATEGIFVTTLEGTLITINPAFAKILGYGSPEQVKREVTDLEGQLYAEPGGREEYLKRLHNKGSLKGYVIPLRHRRGTVVWVEVNVRLVGSGNSVRLEGTMRDITKRRMAEIALQEANVKLEERVRERTEQLTSANVKLRRAHGKLHVAMREAESANRLKSEFLANMSHEIRTPMNGVLGLSELVLRSTISEKQRENIEGIHSSGETLLEIINDILDLSKIEAGRLSLNIGPVNLHGLVDEVMGIITVNSGDGVEVAQQRRGEIPTTVRTDGIRLRQILTNLLGNAVKFTRKGHVLLHLDWEGDNAPGSPGTLHIKVEDSGPGIEPEMQESIFDPFSQGDGSVGREFGGTGLGLSIAQKMVALLGGSEIVLKSTPGVGTIFKFSLPLLVAKESAPVAPQEEEQFTIDPCIAILVAEDWEMNRLLLAQILKDIGVRQFDFVMNGQEACEAILEKSQDYSLILMDVQMPVMGGIEATEKLREAGVDIPIVAVTAHAMKDDQQQCIDAGMNDYLAKPYRVEEIIEVLKRVFA